MSSLISEYINRFRDFYTRSIANRVVSGIVIVGAITGIASITSIFFRFLMQGDDTWQSFLDDIPWIGLIVALIIALEIWGLLPSPTMSQEESIGQDSDDSTMSPTNSVSRLQENLENE